MFRRRAFLLAPLLALLLIGLSGTLPAAEAPTTVELSHTDGFGLLAKPPAADAETGRRLFEAGRQLCDSGCATPFGSLLGTADGAPARSNCQSQCIRPEYSFLDLDNGAISVHSDNPGNDRLHYIGVTYQCVNYARKWWMINQDITFPSIDSAHEIIYLTEGKHIRSGEMFPLARSINGTAKRAPRRGDLLVYYPEPDLPEWRHGHVAVIVAVNEAEGWVALAEENYDNLTWQAPDAYARRISLFKVGEHYTLLDLAPGDRKHAGGGRISGWIYPLERR